MPSTLKAGPLRSRITIEGAAYASDGAGGSTTTWTTFATVWAFKQYQSGGDVIEAEQVVSRQVPTFTIRRRSDITITQAMRVRDGARLYAIRTIAEDDTDRSMTLLICEEVFEES